MCSIHLLCHNVFEQRENITQGQQSFLKYSEFSLDE